MEQLYENVKLQQARKTPKYKDKNCQKKKRLSLRITKHQHEEISKLAKNNGLTVTQYMISKAFEQPQLKFDVGKEIAEMSESINQIKRDRYAMGDNPDEWQSQSDRIESILSNVKDLEKNFNQFKRDLYKSFLSDFERAKFERQEKRLEEKDKKNKMQEE